MEWEQIYAELQNKIRWAIATTCSNAAYNLAFSEAKAMSSLASGDVLAALKAKHRTPDLRLTKEAYTRSSTESGSTQERTLEEKLRASGIPIPNGTTPSP